MHCHAKKTAVKFPPASIGLLELQFLSRPKFWAPVWGGASLEQASTTCYEKIMHTSVLNKLIILHILPYPVVVKIRKDILPV